MAGTRARWRALRASQRAAARDSRAVHETWSAQTMGEAGWRKHVQSRPWTPELVKLPDSIEDDERVEMVAVCDRSGAPKIAVRRDTLLQAHRERGEALRAKLEQRRQDLALAEALSSFGSSSSPPPSSRRSSRRSSPPSPQSESSYVQHVDLGGNVNFRNRGNPAYDLQRDPVRGTAYTPNMQRFDLFGEGHADEEVLARAELVNAHQAAAASYGPWAGWARRPSIYSRSMALSGLGPAAAQGKQAWERQYSPVGGGAAPQGVARSLSSPLAGDGSCPMTWQEMEEQKRRRNSRRHGRARRRTSSVHSVRGWRASLGGPALGGH